MNLPGYGANLLKEEEFFFSGRLEIGVKILQPVREIVLSMKNLTINEINIHHVSARAVEQFCIFIYCFNFISIALLFTVLMFQAV